MAAYIVDTETTGAEPVAEVIELAVGKVEDDLSYTPIFQGYFKPQGRVLFSAMAVHHILPIELEGHPDSVLAKAHLPADMEYMIGHHVDYDWECLGQPACKRICTLALSRWLWPGNDAHNLGTLTYHLTTDLVVARDILRHQHGAGQDVELVYAVLRAMLEQEALKGVDTWEKLWLVSQEARIPTIWSFGKFKGQPIYAADAGYLQWCLKQPDMDEYVKVACRKALAPRPLR
jgi:exodeoxyribonuclease X